MPDQHPAKSAALIGHGAARLPAVDVDTYNAELRCPEGFLGDRASRGAFLAILEDWRESLRKLGDDPLGDVPTEEVSKKKLDKVLLGGDAEAAGLVHGAVEEFAQELAAVTQRLLRLKGWRSTQRIVVGGGLRASRIGEIAIGRASVLLKAAGRGVELKPVRHHPDEAGLIGAAHLAPPWVFSGHDAILAVDIGGTNIRAGIVELNLKKAADLSAAHVMASELWRHRDDGPTREQAVERLSDMLRDLVRRAGKRRLRLAPFVGMGCPGLIRGDGSIERGGQNLPGDWESGRFNLPDRIRELVPAVDGQDTAVVMHNDAVVHGLGEAPFMGDVERWGVLTIGTGLGNARFTNRRSAGG